MFTKLATFFEKKWVHYTLISFGILLIWKIGAYQLRVKAQTQANKIIEPRIQNGTRVLNNIGKLSNADSAKPIKLKELAFLIEDKKEEKKRSFLYLYEYHFASSSLLLILSAISIVIVFIIAQIGLAQASPYLKTIFFTLAALTSFYAFSPLVFKQESNIQKNLASYISFDNLQSEVYNYALTNPGMTSKYEPLSLDSFHSSVINQIQKINTIDFEFDYKVIPLPDFGLTPK